MAELRVAYYTSPWYLDVGLPFVREMSRRFELHVFLQVAPESWSTNLLDVGNMGLPSGVVDADPILGPCFPPGIRACWQGAASFRLVVHNTRTFHPGAWRVGRQAIRCIQQLKPDVLHLEDPMLRLPVWALRGVPLLLSVHDPEPHSGEGGWRDRWACRLTFPRARRFVVHNRGAVEPFCAAYGLPPARVDSVPLGVYDVYREWAAGQVAEDGRTLLFFGRLSPYKGLEVLYGAAPLVAEAVPGMRLIVAGRAEGGYHPPLPPVLPNGGRIEVVDSYIPNAQLAALFGQAAAVVCPYTGATQSGVVLTAYAFGRPVVASAVGGLPEYVRDGESGLLVPPCDERALADALVRVLADRPLRARLRAGVERLTSVELSWSRITEETACSYARMLDGERDADRLLAVQSCRLAQPGPH